MKKLNIFIAAGLALALSSCNEDFVCTTAPQTNPQEASLATSDITVTPIQNKALIYDEMSEDDLIPVAKITVADGKMPANSIPKVTVQISLSDTYAPKSTTIAAESLAETDTVFVTAKNLQDAYYNGLTRSTKQKTVYMRASVEIVTNTTSVAEIGKPGENYYALNQIQFTPQYYEASPEYYMVGDPNNWKLDYSSAFYPTSNSVVTYTGYFKGDYACRISNSDQIEAGSWENFGSETENASCTTLIENTGHCLFSPSAGYYTLTVNMDDMTYSWTPYTGATDVCDNVSLIGDFNGWGGDVDLTKVINGSGQDSHNWGLVNYTFTTDTELKFRKNHDWSISWGYTDDIHSVTDLPYAVGTSDGGKNIKVPAGTYNIYFNDLTCQFYFVAK